MRLKPLSVFTVIAAILLATWYGVEPWALTFVDDGPYYAEDYPGTIDDLTVNSSLQLSRFGSVAYTLESRLLPNDDETVLVLWDSSGHLSWAKKPIKPDGELGSLGLRRAQMTWSGGWRIRIVPSNQEPGDLYLNAFGGFRFFNHSW